VRPENLTLQPQHADDQPLAGSVVLVEPLGAETLVTLRAGDREMMARVAASFAQPPGSAITLHVNASHLHLFDADSGLALRPAD
jgi:multiple sugar transport system ATP-binding protein